MRRHLRRVLCLLLACLWITSASFAEHLSAEFVLCQPEHAPCCPAPVNQAGQNTGQLCPACQILLPVAEKKESKSEPVRFAQLPHDVYEVRPQPPTYALVRELTPGLRYHPAVFQLKDDLRI